MRPQAQPRRKMNPAVKMSRPRLAVPGDQSTIAHDAGIQRTQIDIDKINNR
jgi:hypothetical protein